MAEQLEKCPICGRRAQGAHRPFCSPRCQEVDLGRWLTGVYRIEGPPAEEEESTPASSDLS